MKIITAVSAICCLLLVNGTTLSVEGPEGGVVSFQCSHKMAQNNRKYFCKDPCLPKHILAEVRPGTVTGSEKITLWDTKDGAFSITLSNLSTSDSGTYWCGVDRFVLDTFTRVDLRVKEVKLGINSHSHKTTTTNIDLERGTEDSTGAAFESASTQTHVAIAISMAEIFPTDSGTNSSQGFILYLIVGVVFVFTVCLVISLSFRKCREKSRPQVQKFHRRLQLISSDQNQQVGIRKDSTTDKRESGPTAARLQENQNQPIYENISSIQLSGHATISRNDHFPSYVTPLPALPEQDDVKMAGANGETCTEQASLWFGLACPQT